MAEENCLIVHAAGKQLDLLRGEASRIARGSKVDWWIDPAVWPQGLGPLIEHVRGLGMEFGLWFEPEMVNPDSDLYREHPDWILAAGSREPVVGRVGEMSF